MFDRPELTLELLLIFFLNKKKSLQLCSDSMPSLAGNEKDVFWLCDSY